MLGGSAATTAAGSDEPHGGLTRLRVARAGLCKILAIKPFLSANRIAADTLRASSGLSRSSSCAHLSRSTSEFGFQFRCGSATRIAPPLVASANRALFPIAPRVAALFRILDFRRAAFTLRVFASTPCKAPHEFESRYSPARGQRGPRSRHGRRSQMLLRPSRPAARVRGNRRRALRRRSAISIPDEPKWLNRDRFVLSAGPRLDVPLRLAAPRRATTSRSKQIKNFRVLGQQDARPSRVSSKRRASNATTGPLGQGIANAVGYAVSAENGRGALQHARNTPFSTNQSSRWPATAACRRASRRRRSRSPAISSSIT